MTVRYVPLLKTQQDGCDWLVLKCFYGEEQSLTYGEFFLLMDFKHHLIRFESKEGGYAASLTQAFQQAMRQL